MEPLNAVAAACHPDPYPYYRRLLSGPALVFDDSLGLWIASQAAVIEEVMDNPHCLVRPPAETVPKAIAGSEAGAVFARLVRMTEGSAQADGKRAIIQALAAVDLAPLEQRCAMIAAMLGQPTDAALTLWIRDFPTWVVADLLGFGAHELPQVAQWTADFVCALSPLSTPGQLARASVAAHALKERIAQLLDADGLARQVAQAGWADQDALIANLVGLLSQTHEATAGLIGNCIVALLGQPGTQERLREDPQLASAFVQEVARDDPAVQNTRRFVAHDTSVAGVSLKRGDAILLLLAAACHGEQAKPLGFGHGRHACPGQALAFTIAASALRHLLELPAQGYTYAQSVNGRLPRFGAAQ
jgi:cytochrome P450